MKNKRELFIGIFVVLTTALTMIFSLYYSANLLKENAKTVSSPVIINKKDPKLKIKNWGFNRTRTKKDAMIEKMMQN